MKLTPWFPNEYKPARPGVYEIRGSRYFKSAFRRWNGKQWSCTWGAPKYVYEHCGYVYDHGEDMTGWRGIEKE